MNIKNNKIEEQIYEKRKSVRYDIRDLTVEQIVKKYSDSLSDDCIEQNYGSIYIPDYQRDFTWDEKRQSRLIESIILGLPIPFIFVAENKNGAWEIVDGSQRIRTLHSFIKNKLTLVNLDSLTLLNETKFETLELSRQAKIKDTALRLIVLSEETTEEAKKDMFERINRGSDLLKPMESRKGIYKGKFNDFIYELTNEDKKFIEMTPLDKWNENRQEREELLLRFFYLSDNNNYSKKIDTGIAKVLDKYLEKQNARLEGKSATEITDFLKKYKAKIKKVENFVEKTFPYGFRKTHNPQTKRTVFEAISVGSWIFLEGNAYNNTKFNSKEIEKKLNSPQFNKIIVGAQLHKKKLKERVNFVVEVLKDARI